MIYDNRAIWLEPFLKKEHILLKILFLYIFLAYITAFSGRVSACTQEQEVFERIHEGLTKTDLTGDGIQEIVLKTWRENFNDHGYYVIQFLKLRKRSVDSLDIIGIDYGYDDSKPFAHELQGLSTADCITQDQRLVSLGKQTFLIEANLHHKDFYCVEAPVTFRVFRMSNNEEGVPGTTEYYFDLIKKWTTTDTYTDLNQAFCQNSEKLISDIR